MNDPHWSSPPSWRGSSVVVAHWYSTVGVMAWMVPVGSAVVSNSWSAASMVSVRAVIVSMATVIVPVVIVVVVIVNSRMVPIAHVWVSSVSRIHKDIVSVPPVAVAISMAVSIVSSVAVAPWMVPAMVVPVAVSSIIVAPSWMVPAVVISMTPAMFPPSAAATVPTPPSTPPYTFSLATFTYTATALPSRTSWMCRSSWPVDTMPPCSCWPGWPRPPTARPMDNRYSSATSRIKTSPPDTTPS